MIRKLTIDQLLPGMYVVDLHKSWLDVSSVPELELHGHLTDVDLSKLPGAATHQLQGQGSLRADLHGRGVSVDALVHALTGPVRVSGREIRGQGHMTHKVTVVNPLLGKLAERLRKKQGDRQVALHFREASALFALGANKLTLKEPALLRADAFTIHLDGAVGLDGAPALDGQIDIAPQAIADATKG